MPMSHRIYMSLPLLTFSSRWPPSEAWLHFLFQESYGHYTHVFHHCHFSSSFFSLRFFIARQGWQSYSQLRCLPSFHVIFPVFAAVVICHHFPSIIFWEDVRYSSFTVLSFTSPFFCLQVLSYKMPLHIYYFHFLPSRLDISYFPSSRQILQKRTLLPQYTEVVFCLSQTRGREDGDW